MEFKRPKGLYPMVYATFKLKSKNGDEDEVFFIQDLTENYFDEAVTIIVDNHVRGAVFHKAAKALSSECGNRRINEIYRNVFKEKISLICFKMDNMEIVGINAVTSGESEATNDPNLNLMRDTVAFINNEFNVMEHYGVNRILTTDGLCVAKKYRGRGIATQILKARAPLLKSVGVRVTSSIFSTIEAQKAAARAGYDENYSISYEELNKKFPKMDFSHVFGGLCKVMSLKV